MGECALSLGSSLRVSDFMAFLVSLHGVFTDDMINVVIENVLQKLMCS